MLVETDVLLAVINANDPLREYGIKAFNRRDLILSPFSLLELNLLRRSLEIEVSDFQAFVQGISELLAQKEVKLLPDRPEYHYEANALEKRFHLTFFDSLHAGVSKVEGETMLSFDKAYDRLTNSGVRRTDPRDL